MNRIYNIVFLVLVSMSVAAQVTLSVTSSSDTIGLEDLIKVNYTLTDARSSIEVLDFERWQVVQGPNVSSSFTMINGATSQEYSQSYILLPIEAGELYLPSASTVVDEQVLETDPKAIVVLVDQHYQSISDHQNKTSKAAPVKTHKEEEQEYQRILKKRELAKKKKKF